MREQVIRDRIATILSLLSVLTMYVKYLEEEALKAYKLLEDLDDDIELEPLKLDLIKTILEDNDEIHSSDR